MIAAMPVMRPPSSCEIAMLNSIEMRVPSLRIAGTASMSPLP
jgi:hypothetical protein